VISIQRAPFEINSSLSLCGYYDVLMLGVEIGPGAKHNRYNYLAGYHYYYMDAPSKWYLSIRLYIKKNNYI